MGHSVAWYALRKKGEMSDLLLGDVFWSDAQMGIGTAREIAEQAFDGRDCTVGIVCNADCQGFRGHCREGQGTESVDERATAWARFIAAGGRTPVTDDPSRGVFEPAKTFTGEKTAEHCDQRHHHMPFTEHPPAMSRRIVAPVSELRADGHQAPDDMPGRPQARRTAAEAVADNVNGLAGEFALGALEHRLEIQRTPVGP